MKSSLHGHFKIIGVLKNQNKIRQPSTPNFPVDVSGYFHSTPSKRRRLNQTAGSMQNSGQSTDSTNGSQASQTSNNKTNNKQNDSNGRSSSDQKSESQKSRPRAKSDTNEKDLPGMSAGQNPSGDSPSPSSNSQNKSKDNESDQKSDSRSDSSIQSSQSNRGHSNYTPQDINKIVNQTNSILDELIDDLKQDNNQNNWTRIRTNWQNKIEEVIEILKSKLPSEPEFDDYESGYFAGPEFDCEQYAYNENESTVTGNPIKFDVFMMPKERQNPVPAVVLLIDGSNSMDKAIAGVQESIVILAESFEKLRVPYGVILFSGAPTLLMTPDHSLQQNDSQKAHWLNQIRAEGGTNTAAAFKMAVDLEQSDQLFKDRMNKIIFVITDGETQDEDILHDTVQSWVGQSHEGSNKAYGIGLAGVNKDLLVKHFQKGTNIQQINELPEALAEMID